jgi:hypothetical protein
LRFHTPGAAAESIEPGPFFRLVGPMLCRGPANEPVATLGAQWRLADAEFARADALDTLVLYFENNAGLASSAYGPFEAFHVSERAAWAGSRLLATLDEKVQLWFPPRAQDGWASLLIAPPDRSRFDLFGERE